MRRRLTALLAALILVVASHVRLPAAEYSWSGGSDADDWYDTMYLYTDPFEVPIYANNWGFVGALPLSTPGPSDNATIGVGTAVIGCPNPVTIQNLTIGGGAALTDTDGGVLTVQGPAIANAGTLTISFAGGCGDAHLAIPGTTALSGAGTLVFGGGYLEGAGSLSVGAGSLIRGREARIDVALDNSGTVDADMSGGAIQLRAAAKTNRALMRASNGGYLDLYTSLTQLDAGQLAAEGGTVRLHAGSVITGGTTASLPGSQFIVSGGGETAQLGDLTNTGDWLAQDGAIVTLAGSGITNDGAFEVGGYTGGSGWAHLRASNPVSLAGSGVLTLDLGYLDGAETITNAENHTISGRGTISAPLTNAGTIRADVSGQILRLDGYPKVNNAQLLVMGGALLDLYAPVSHGVDGSLGANDGTVRLYGGSAISGGHTASSGSGRFQIGGGGVETTLSDLANSGSWLAENGAVVNLGGVGITNDGVFEIGGDTGGWGWAHLRAVSSAAISGAGALVLNPGLIDGSGTISNGAGHLIHGRGTISAALTNAGTLSADSAAGALRLDGSPKVNTGAITALLGATLELYASVSQAPTATMTADGGTIRLYGGTLTGGTLVTAGGGSFLAKDGITATLADLTNNGSVLAENCANLQLGGSGLTNNGSLQIGGYTGGCGRASLKPQNSLSLTGGGELFLNPGIVDAPAPLTLINAAGHTLRAGTGEIRANVTLDNQGTVDVSGGTLTLVGAPAQLSGTALTGGTWRIGANGTLQVNGGSDIATNQADVTLRGANSNFARLASLATNAGSLTLGDDRDFATAGALLNSGSVTLGPRSVLSVNGDYTQASALVIHLGGAPGSGNFGKLGVTGIATFGGTLKAVLVDGYAPAHGDVFEVVTFASSSGTFSAFDLPAPFKAQITATGVRLLAGYPPEAVSDAARTVSEVSVLVDALANDTDSDGDPLSLAGVGTPTHGAAAIEGGALRYTPSTGFAGTDSFTYTVSDGRGNTDTGTVTVIVLGPPTWVAASNGTRTDSILVQWEDVANEEGYAIYRARAAAGPYGLVATTAADVATYLDRAPLCGPNTYYYRVAARDVADETGPSPQDGGATRACPDPLLLEKFADGVLGDVDPQWQVPLGVWRVVLVSGDRVFASSAASARALALLRNRTFISGRIGLEVRVGSALGTHRRDGRVIFNYRGSALYRYAAIQQKTDGWYLVLGQTGAYDGDSAGMLDQVKLVGFSPAAWARIHLDVYADGTVRALLRQKTTTEREWIVGGKFGKNSGGSLGLLSLWTSMQADDFAIWSAALLNQ